MKSRAFTLIELLVVVLIIGILAAIALPQYETAVEKARMTEAIGILHSIARAHQVYYLANNTHVGSDQMDLLDVDIPGEIIPNGSYKNRIKTKYFVYAPVAIGSTTDWAHARRYDTSPKDQIYTLRLSEASPDRIVCAIMYDDGVTKATKIQQKLCRQLNSVGYF